MEVNSFAVLLAGAICISFLGGYVGTGILTIFDHVFRNAFSLGLNTGTLQNLYMTVAGKFALIFAPVALLLALAALGSNLLQIGFVFSADPLTPKLEKISPLKGFERIVSKSTLMELLKSFLKIGAVGLVAWLTIKGELENFFPLVDESLFALVAMIRHSILLILTRVILVLAVIALLDFAFQRQRHEEKLKMTKQEVKEEYKETEGDPLIKSRARSIARQLAMSRMMQDVPDADVVVTNPTRLAVAISYKDESMQAPVVVAKGAEKMAARIREIARNHDVPIMENKPLAQVLYREVEIGDSIPARLYEAVAEVLAYVYMLKKRRA